MRRDMGLSASACSTTGRVGQADKVIITMHSIKTDRWCYMQDAPGCCWSIQRTPCRCDARDRGSSESKLSHWTCTEINSIYELLVVEYQFSVEVWECRSRHLVNGSSNWGNEEDQGKEGEYLKTIRSCWMGIFESAGLALSPCLLKTVCFPITLLDFENASILGDSFGQQSNCRKRPIETPTCTPRRQSTRQI